VRNWGVPVVRLTAQVMMPADRDADVRPAAGVEKRRQHFEVLPQFRSIELGIYAVYPSRRHVTAKVRLMIDFLVAAFRAPAWA